MSARIILVVQSMLLLFVQGCFASDKVEPTGNEPPPSVEEVVTKVRKAYAECSSYKDEMTFTRTGDSLGASTPRTGRVETMFLRPGLLRVDVRIHKDEHNVLWYLDGTAKAYFKVENAFTIRTLPNLCTLIAQDTGELAHHIPNLLLPKELAFPDLFTEGMIDRIAPQTESVENVDCYVVSGEKPGPIQNLAYSMKVWIGTKDFLIRRIESTGKVSGTVQQSAVGNFKPQVNLALSRSAFKFVPPASAVERD